MSIAFKLNLKESGRKKSFEQFFVYDFLIFENYLQKKPHNKIVNIFVCKQNVVLLVTVHILCT